MDGASASLHYMLRVALAALLPIAAAVADQPREPVDLIPADSLLCWYGRPLPEVTGDAQPGGVPAASQPSTLQTLLELGTRIAGQPLDSGLQLNVRMAEMFALLIRYPHALALVDARAKPLENDPRARRVDQLRFALVVQNRDHTEPFLRIIQKAVNEQTDSAAATLVSKKAERWGYQELRDRRLPDWAAIAWGHVDGHFVLTVGEEVWPLIAAVAVGDSPSLSNDPWYGAARRGSTRVSSAKQPALIEIFVAAEAIQQRLDPFVDGRASAFFRAWDAGQLQQAHWALGFDGRALYCRAHFRIGGETVARVYADPDARDPRLLGVVPPEARYAICNIPLGRLLPRFCRGLLAIQGEKVRTNVERLWAETQVEHGFDAERDLLTHLGQHVVLHNDPPHPLHIPLAMTVLVEIHDEPATVRRTLETMCAAWRAALDKTGPDGKQPGPFTLQRDDDGVWYLRFGAAGSGWLGLAGPAWTTTDRFIILSWSPLALREYLDKVGAGVR